jgi:hypothetical protein
VTTATQTAIHDGFYTITCNGTHRTFRIRTQNQDANFALGKQIVGFLNGPDNTSDYVQFAFILDGKLVPWKRFQNGYHTILEAARFLISPGSHQEAAGKMYAQGSGNCWRCNRLLTTPERIAAGIGPTCASRI